MLKIKNVSKQFGGKSALKDISVDIDEGQIIGLIGENGAGKSTLLNIVAGLESATSGEVIVDACCNKIVILPDVPEYFSFLKSREYLSFISKEKNDIYIDHLLNLCGFDGTELIAKMSRGMKQKLGIVSAMVNSPDILILDEPTSALDPSWRIKLSEILNDLRTKGKTIIISSHILNDLERICDKVIFIDNGKILKVLEMNGKDINPQTLLIEYENGNQCKFPFNNLASQIKTFQTLIDNAMLVKEIVVSKSTLEDIFMELTKHE